MNDQDAPKGALDATDQAAGDDLTATPIDRRMLEALICPVTYGPLTYDPVRGELVSRGAGLAFPIREGIPIMLESEARIIAQD
jgi:uncharacterized protein